MPLCLFPLRQGLRRVRGVPGQGQVRREEREEARLRASPALQRARRPRGGGQEEARAQEEEAERGRDGGAAAERAAADNQHSGK